MKKIFFFLLFFSITFQYKGVDLSDWDGEIDWEKLSKNIDFAILRAGSNFGVSDLQFENNYNGAKKYGIPIGVYWYSYAHNEEEAALEAKGCLERIQGKQYEYPIYYDIEEPEIFETGLTSQILDTFCTILEKAGYYCGVYCSPYFLNTYFDKDILSKYTLWVAYWEPDEPSIPHSLWQYGFEYYDGTNGKVDADTSNTDFASVMKEHHLNGY